MTVLTLVPAFVLILAGCAVTFGVLCQFFPCNAGQRLFFCRTVAIDCLYCAIGLFYAGLVPIGVMLACALLFRGDAAKVTTALVNGGYGWFSHRSLWLQTAMLLAMTDCLQYWAHRAFHGVRLWPFHAIHHSAEEVNWTTAFRVHPVNYLLANTMLAILGRLLGFSPRAYLFAAMLAFISTVVTHANLNWRFGPLRYCLVSPVLHRWHHTRFPQSQDVNFATILALWDVIFGTFYMPPDRLPEAYGVVGVPPDVVGQMLYPFQAMLGGIKGGRQLEPSGDSRGGQDRG